MLDRCDFGEFFQCREYRAANDNPDYLSYVELKNIYRDVYVYNVNTTSDIRQLLLQDDMHMCLNDESIFECTASNTDDRTLWKKEEVKVFVMTPKEPVMITAGEEIRWKVAFTMHETGQREEFGRHVEGYLSLRIHSKVDDLRNYVYSILIVSAILIML